jgi:hypothetical protein
MESPEFKAALSALTPALGPSRALSAAMSGVSVDYAKFLNTTPAGRRLFDRDPAARIGDSAFASILGISIFEFGPMVGNLVPPPDDKGGGIELRGGAYCAKFRSWSMGKVGKWLALGCPNKHGRPNRFIAEKVGALPSGG